MKKVLMMMRVALLIALVIGLGEMFSFYSATPVLIDVHIAAGIVVLAAMITIARTSRQSVAWIGVVLVAIGGVEAWMSTNMSMATGLVHLALIVVGVGLTEMSASRYQKSSS